MVKEKTVHQKPVGTVYIINIFFTMSAFLLHLYIHLLFIFLHVILTFRFCLLLIPEQNWFEQKQKKKQKIKHQNLFCMKSLGNRHIKLTYQRSVSVDFEYVARSPKLNKKEE